MKNITTSTCRVNSNCRKTIFSNIARSYVLVVLLLPLALHPLKAEVTMPRIFSGHMVHQEATAVPGWGKADRGGAESGASASGASASRF